MQLFARSGSDREVATLSLSVCAIQIYAFLPILGILKSFFLQIVGIVSACICRLAFYF